MQQANAGGGGGGIRVQQTYVVALPVLKAHLLARPFVGAVASQTLYALREIVGDCNYNLDMGPDRTGNLYVYRCRAGEGRRKGHPRSLMDHLCAVLVTADDLRDLEVTLTAKQLDFLGFRVAAQ